MINPTPKQIAIASSLFISLLLFCILWLLRVFWDTNISWQLSIIIASLSCIIAYIIIINALEVFIYRKVKLIYKLISKAKVTKEKASSIMQMSNDIIRNVEKETIENLESEQRELEQLKKLEEYRRQFLGNVSHELKTPIFHIQGYIETLIDGGLYDESINMQYLKKAAKNIDRLTAIIEDLETISLIEDGKLNLLIKKFNAAELVHEVFDSLSLLARQNEIELKVKKGFMTPCYVKADKEKIRQVLINLISNAIKYNKPHGTVSIGTYDMDNKILIEVSDNGLGIDPEHLPRIFERFYTVDKSRSREKGGTGLGLSIVKHIVEAHNETINVRSTPGQGSTFGFTLQKA